MFSPTKWILVSVGLSASLTLTAAENPARPERIRIGLAAEPPFAVQAGDRWQGLTADFWGAVQKRTGVAIDWIPATPQTSAELLAQRKIDVGPLMTITAGRLQHMEFSLPILPSGLAIATMPVQRWEWTAWFRQAWNTGIFTVIAVILAINALVGVVLWRIERRANPTNFGGGSAQGVASGIWCSVTTMTTVGYGDKVPITFAGRALCFLLMLTGVVAISLFTAAATSLLTVSHLRPRIHTVDDLKHAISVVVEGSNAAAYLKRTQSPFVTARNFDEARFLFERNDAVAFVHERVELRAGFQATPARVVILPIDLEEEFYAFPLAPDTPLRRWLNRAIQDVLDSKEWDDITSTYLRK